MTRRQRLTQLVDEIKRHQCSLRAGCIQAVPGEGDPAAKAMFIGEAPGAKEDELGRPFVGRSGKLLELALANIGWLRGQVYITNVVKCRPPGNRKPRAAEVVEHRPYLEAELELVGPRLIVLLGLTAAQVFFPKARLTDLRGELRMQNGLAFLATFHPSATFRYPDKRQLFMDDVARLPALLAKLG